MQAVCRKERRKNDLQTLFKSGSLQKLTGAARIVPTFYNRFLEAGYDLGCTAVQGLCSPHLPLIRDLVCRVPRARSLQNRCRCCAAVAFCGILPNTEVFRPLCLDSFSSPDGITAESTSASPTSPLPRHFLTPTPNYSAWFTKRVRRVKARGASGVTGLAMVSITDWFKVSTPPQASKPCQTLPASLVTSQSGWLSSQVST